MSIARVNLFYQFLLSALLFPIFHQSFSLYSCDICRNGLCLLSTSIYVHFGFNFTFAAKIISLCYVSFEYIYIFFLFNCSGMGKVSYLQGRVVCDVPFVLAFTGSTYGVEHLNLHLDILNIAGLRAQL